MLRRVLLFRFFRPEGGSARLMNMRGIGKVTPAQFSVALRIYAALAARDIQAGLRFGFGYGPEKGC